MSKQFKPAFGLSNRHIQTLYSSFFRKSLKLDFKIEKFELPDGDGVDCYWYEKPDKNSSKPIVILFHGLAGSYKSPYIQGTMQKLSELGFSSVVMHFRGCSGEANKLPRAYHSGDTGDSTLWIQNVKKNFPTSKLFAIGYSLGGNMLLKYLGEKKEDSLLDGAISVSAPLQLDICANKMDKGFSKVYQKHLITNLKLPLEEKYNKHDMESLIGLKKESIKKIRTFWEFDEVYTAPIHGFESAKDYYTKSSSKQFLKDIKTPTLIIHSIDDPFMTPEILPNKDELSESIKLEISSNGGHVGFISGSLFKPSFWLEDRVTKYFKSLNLLSNSGFYITLTFFIISKI
ncbi:MAG: hydrolase [Campylobacterota bacterium]|nr:hydrolase [Campylobacterota bacterium]